MKGREKAKPLALFADSVDTLKKFDLYLNDNAEKLAEKLCPGALTVVVPDPSALTCAALDRDMLGGRPIFGRDDLHAVAGFVLSEAWPSWS